MQINANFKRTIDSVRILKKLDELEDLQRGDIKVLFNNRSSDDQKLLKHLSTSLGKSRWHKFTPEMLKTIALATISSISVMALGFASLLGYI